MSITIPVWLLWAVGIPAALAVLLLAVVGAVLLWALKDGVWRQ